jgi:exodeoxyribonuclease VII large subunit
MDASSARSVEIFTIARLTTLIRQSIAPQFRDILVEGEVSNQRLYPSGHLYFTLKDDAAMIKAVFFGFSVRFSGVDLEDGIHIICRGRVDVYEKRGEYQLIVEDFEVRGLGILQLRFERLKEKLLKEGLFDEARKKLIPFLPHHVGIVTSSAGAAIRDMLKVIGRKFPGMRVTIYPVKVQGDEAAREIIEAVGHFNASGEPDVIILARGGGSLEDLSPFNDEDLARAIAASRIPIVSGIGHEIDYTIADFVADVRTPTPTAAAELVVKDRAELKKLVEGMKEGLAAAVKGLLEGRRLSLIRAEMRLKEQKDVITSQRFYVDDLLKSLVHAFTVFSADKRTRVDQLSQRLRDLNPENILRRGFSITLKERTGQVVTDASAVEKGEPLRVLLGKGELGVTVVKAAKGS